MPLRHGEYHPRIWRGDYVIDCQAFNSFVGSFRIIIELLDDLFRTVEPTSGNKDCYGHKFRHLLILACTEVEASCRGVLEANGYVAPNNRYNTNDYVKLLPAMKLDEWQFSLSLYKDYGNFYPFKNWNKRNPTESLPWYDAYNLVKHDREGNMNKATLDNVINSVAALLAMGSAQFGIDKFRGYMPYDFNQKIFILTPPKWMNEKYAPPPSGSKWTPVNYDFV